MSTCLLSFWVVAAASCLMGDKLPVPSAPDQEEAARIVNDLGYRDAYQQTRTLEEKLRLADQMVAVAGQTADDPALRYVLLWIARDIALVVVYLNGVELIRWTGSGQRLSVRADEWRPRDRRMIGVCNLSGGLFEFTQLKLRDVGVSSVATEPGGTRRNRASAH